MLCCETGYISAHVVPRKGVEAYAIQRVSQVISGVMGYRRIVFESDQGPALIALKNAVQQECSTDIAMEYVPVGASQSNGAVERAVQEVKAHVRTIRLVLQARYGRKIEEHDHIIPWLVKDAAEQINRFIMVGPDGRTRSERPRGRRWLRVMAEIGECLHYRRLGEDRPGKKKTFGTMWEEGSWLGVCEESGEIIVGTERGVVRASAFRRKATNEERWNRERFDKFVGVPVASSPAT